MWGWVWTHLLPTRESCGRESGRGSPSVCRGLDPTGCGVLWCWLEIMSFVLFLSGLPGAPLVFLVIIQKRARRKTALIFGVRPQTGRSCWFLFPIVVRLVFLELQVGQTPAAGVAPGASACVCIA